MQALACFEQEPGGDRRRSRRRALKLSAAFAGSSEEVTIHDLSATGILIETTAELHKLDLVELELLEAGTTLAIAAWHSGKYVGCEFADRIPSAAISAALLRNPPEPVGDVPQPEECGPDEGADENKLSLTVRLRVIVVMSLVFWTAIAATGYCLIRAA